MYRRTCLTASLVLALLTIGVWTVQGQQSQGPNTWPERNRRRRRRGHNLPDRPELVDRVARPVVHRRAHRAASFFSMQRQAADRRGRTAATKRPELTRRLGAKHAGPADYRNLLERAGVRRVPPGRALQQRASCVRDPGRKRVGISISGAGNKCRKQLSREVRHITIRHDVINQGSLQQGIAQVIHYTSTPRATVLYSR